MNEEELKERNSISQDIRAKMLDFKYDIITKIWGDED